MFVRDMYQVYEINDDWLIDWLYVCNTKFEADCSSTAPGSTW